MVYRTQQLAAAAIALSFVVLSSPSLHAATSYPVRFSSMGVAQTTYRDGTLDAPLAGSELIFTPTIENTGTTPGTVTLELDVPYGGAFVRPWTTGLTCSSGPTVSCALPTLAPGGKFTPGLWVRLPGTAGKATFTAALRAGALGRVDTFGETFLVAARDVRLSLQMLTATASVAPGASVVETMRVKNSGTHYTTAMTISATMSPTLTVRNVTAGPLGGTCSPAPSVRCTDIVLGPGESADVVVDLKASSSSAVATFTGSVISFTTSSRTADATIVIGDGLATTVTTLTADRSSATAGQPLTYTAKVTNSGPGDAHMVKTRIVLNSGGSIASATGDGFSACTVQQQYAVDCEAPLLAHGATAVATLNVVAPPSPVTEVSVTATTTTLNGPAQTVVVSTPIGASPRDVAVAAQESARSALAGQRTPIHFDVTNPSGSDAANVTLDLTLTPGLMLDSIATTAGSCVATHCTLGTLKAGAKEMVTVTVAGAVAGAQAVSAAVTCDAQESTAADDAASVSINVTAARNRAARH